jgi:hypothetical protein
VSKIKVVGVLLVAAGAIAFVGIGQAAGSAGAGDGKTTVKKTHKHHSSHTAHSTSSPSSSKPTMTPDQTYKYWTKARMHSAGPPHTTVPGGPQPSGGSGSSGSSAPGKG